MSETNTERAWIYKTTAKKKYGLTDNQIRLAIEKNIVRYRVVRNPHYSSAPDAALLSVQDIEVNLETIRSFPRYSEEEKTRRKNYQRRYRRRKKALEELAFYCPRCGRMVYPPRDSRTLSELVDDALGVDTAKTIFMIAHYRHAHTSYDVDRRNVEKWLKGNELREWRDIIKHYEKRKRRMDRYEREMYLEEIRSYKSLANERAKEHYNNVARQLLIEDGLLKPA
ncbi:hypothetical protein [Infirmifilum sp. NZ]|uniref:hypothetical protein n=1 Tax=Infirmifilum sp. NZ TaxID=2926850 RepID=UPI0027A511C6|nr:hypothetical protein [Infirmifilum sp. NZ]UNQ73074.1 hypothetical protein MOV14_08165 [Infirmifilum sp. NZ]